MCVSYTDALYKNTQCVPSVNKGVNILLKVVILSSANSYISILE